MSRSTRGLAKQIRGRLWALLALGALSLATQGCFDPLVGARCADGYVPCHGRCVATCTDDAGQGDGSAGHDGGLDPNDDGRASSDADDRDDGARSDAGRGDGDVDDGGLDLDATRGDGITDDDAVVPPLADGAFPLPDGALPPDAGVSDASDIDVPIGDATVTDADLPDAAVTDATITDATITDATITDADLSDAAVTDATITDADQPDTAITPPPPDAAPLPDATLPPDCGPMLVRCSGVCTNLDDDPDNCGSCGFGCGTGICVNGVCQQRQSGHLVVIGHDYAVSRSAMDNIVGNAVFLAPGNPVKVVTYQGAASTEAINGTDGAIQRIATATGRAWIKATANAAGVPGALPMADVFLIYAQSGATDPELVALGQQWAVAMTDFVTAGKTIILLEGFYANAGTFQIAREANLFHANARFDATGQSVTVVRPGDAVALRVPQTYRGERGTVWFDSGDDTVVVRVVTDAGLEPVVLHLVF